MAGQFLLHSSEGDVYSVDEVQGWLKETGWDPLSHQGPDRGDWPSCGGGDYMTCDVPGRRL